LLDSDQARNSKIWNENMKAIDSTSIVVGVPDQARNPRLAFVVSGQVRNPSLAFVVSEQARNPRLALMVSGQVRCPKTYKQDSSHRSVE